MENRDTRCLRCGDLINKDENFCVHCGTKLHESCGCWVLKKPYNCGLKKCPGKRLYAILFKDREIF